MTDNGAMTREPGPISFEPAMIYGPDEVEALALDWEDAVHDDWVYGDFPHGANLMVEVRAGHGLNIVMEAEMRARAWVLLTEQAVVQGITLGRFTYREVGEALGISTSAAHKRYAHYLRPL